MAPPAVDAAIAAGFLATSLAVLWGGNPDTGTVDSRGADAVSVLVVALGSVPLAWRRRRPGVVLALVLLAAVFAMALAVQPLPTDWASWLALYSFAAYSSLSWAARWGLVLAAAAVDGLTRIELELADIDTAAVFLVGFVLVFLLLPAGVGELVRRWRAKAARQSERAAELERRRALDAARAVQARRRIARELHDSVGHYLTVAVLHADARADGDVEAQGLADAGRRALVELHDLVDLLDRDSVEQVDDVEGGGETGAGVARPAGHSAGREVLGAGLTLADLDSLVAPVRRTGLTVTVEVTGEPRELALPVDLTGCRVVQEALTNTLRHSGATQVVVAVHYEPGEVVVAVSDDGRGASGEAPTGSGSGLRGIRDRARLLGGSLAVSEQDGGFTVQVRLPTEPVPV